MSKRPEGSGKSFEDQWNHSRRLGQARAARGEGPWAIDKALERNATSHTPQPGEAGHSGPRHAKSSDSCVGAIALLGGLAWALSEAAGKVFS